MNGVMSSKMTIVNNYREKIETGRFMHMLNLMMDQTRPLHGPSEQTQREKQADELH